MSSTPLHFFRLCVGLALMLSLLVPSLASVAYQCGESGEMLAAPCAQDNRAAPATARNCCGEEGHAPELPTESSTCCRTISTEQSILPSQITFEAPDVVTDLTSVHVSLRGLQGGTGRPNAVRPTESPPGDPPSYVLHCQFLI